MRCQTGAYGREGGSRNVREPFDIVLGEDLALETGRSDDRRRKGVEVGLEPPAVVMASQGRVEAEEKKKDEPVGLNLRRKMRLGGGDNGTDTALELVLVEGVEASSRELVLFELNELRKEDD